MDKSKISPLLLFFICLVFLVQPESLKAQRIEILQQGKPTSLRGLSIVNDHVAWVSGSNGYVGVTHNGGNTWIWQQVKGFEKSDFRSVVAFSGEEALLMSSGTPAVILKTKDGGKSWHQEYRNDDKAFFFDAMAFSDPQHGWVLGDPIQNKFLLLQTNDGGETWVNQANLSPVAKANESAFAASGTCLRVMGHEMFIVSGGAVANLFHSKNGGKSWKTKPLSIINGASSQGAFSIAVSGQNMVVVGGDYQRDQQADNTSCFSVDHGENWQISRRPLSGYQSCVEYIQGLVFLSTGTAGSNLSTDGGQNWSKLDSNSFNVCRKADQGKLILMAGNNGKIGIFKF